MRSASAAAIDTVVFVIPPGSAEHRKALDGLRVTIVEDVQGVRLGAAVAHDPDTPQEWQDWKTAQEGQRRRT